MDIRPSSERDALDVRPVPDVSYCVRSVTCKTELHTKREQNISLEDWPDISNAHGSVQDAKGCN